MEKDKYTIERISKERLRDLQQLYIASFGKGFKMSYLEKKFNTAYTGVSWLGFVAYDEKGKPAAYYGVFPCFINYKGKRMLSAQSGDTMTHPSHQGKGLFTHLARTTYELAKQEGVTFIFGFPNKNSHPGFIKKLNWKDKGPMCEFTFRIKTVPIAAALQKIRPLHRFYTRIISNFLCRKEGDSFLTNSVFENNFSGIDRSREFYSYKQYEPNFSANINGKQLWLKVDHRLLIGDCEVCSQDEFAKIITLLKRKAMWLGIRRIIFIVGKDTWFYSITKGIKGVNERHTLSDCYLDNELAIDPSEIRFMGADWDTF